MKTIFLGGAQRTGTTLLQLALCQSPDTNEMLGEARYFTELLRAYRRSARTNEISSYFTNPKQFTEFHQKILYSFLAQSSAHLGNPDTLVLKDPNFARLLPELLHLVPHARVILLARDPRDAIASMKRVNQRAIELYGKPALPQSIAHLCQHFLSFYATALHPNNQELFKERVRVLRYEDLVLKAEETFGMLSTFSGISLSEVDEETEFSSGKLNYSEDQEISPWWSKHYGKAFQASSIGAYAKELSDEEVLEIQSHCKGFMHVLGYASSSNG